jgi:hypothetical protein
VCNGISLTERTKARLAGTVLDWDQRPPARRSQGAGEQKMTAPDDRRGVKPLRDSPISWNFWHTIGIASAMLGLNVGNRRFRTCLEISPAR